VRVSSDLVVDVVARAAVRQYRSSYRRLRLEALALRADPRRPLTRRIVARRAEIARRAMIAEMTDPKPENR